MLDNIPSGHEVIYARNTSSCGFNSSGPDVLLDLEIMVNSRTFSQQHLNDLQPVLL